MELNNEKELLDKLKADTNQLRTSEKTGIPQGNISRALNKSCSFSTFVKICNANSIKIDLNKLVLICMILLSGCGRYLPLTCKLPSKTIEVSKSKQQIINDTEAFIALTFNSAKAVIEISNDDVIVGSGAYIPKKSLIWKYNFVVRAKDNKVSYYFDNIKLNDIGHYDNNSAYKPKVMWDNHRELICQSLTDISMRFEEYIKKDHSNF